MTTTTPDNGSGVPVDPALAIDPPPDVVVAVYADEESLTDAIRQLEHAKFPMAAISVVGKGMSEERHVVGFDTPDRHTARWAKWGGLWGWVFGAFFFVPGVGHVAIGGYLLYLLATTGVGVAAGAFAGALTSMGVPAEGVPLYVADLEAERYLLIVHGPALTVEGARQILEPRTHERIDHHTVPAAS